MSMSSSRNVCGNGKRRSELMKVFDSHSTSAEKMLKAYRKLEKICDDDEKQLGVASWRLAQQLFEEDKDPEQVLYFGKRALKTLIHDETPSRSLFLGSLLTLLGKACYKLSRFDESLSYLNWANRNLCNLELDKSSPAAELVLPALLATQNHLYVVKFSMGRTDELLVHANKVLEIQEKLVSDESCMKLGRANEFVSNAYVMVKKVKEALPFSLKAVEIYTKHLGQDSAEVVKLRMHIARLYFTLGDYEKAIEQNKIAQSVLKGEKGCGTDELIIAELDNGYMLMLLGRYQEALAVLKGVVPNVVDNGSELARRFVSMANDFCNMEEFAHVHKFIKEGPSAVDKLDEAFAFMNLIEENVGGLGEKSITTVAPQPRDDEDFSAKNTASIILKDRKPSSSH